MRERDQRRQEVFVPLSHPPGHGQVYYLSTIAISGDLHDLGDKQLVAGMPVEVFFTTQERSALSYLVKPFTDQMMRSFREE
jgi:HlyD family secretion protein